MNSDQKMSERTRFRLLAFQPLSLAMEKAGIFRLKIRDTSCRFAMKPVHIDSASRRTKGGAFICVEFATMNEADLMKATNTGMDLIGEESN